MNFEYEFAKLETLVKHGFTEQAKQVGRAALVELEQGSGNDDKLQLFLEFLACNNISLYETELPTVESANIQVDDFVSNKKAGISIVTACMNRNSNLLKAVQTWIELEEVDEILIVDWSSEKSVYCDLQKSGLLDPRVKVVRVEQQPRWVLTYAFNIGFRLAAYDTILKADADIIISKDFFTKNQLDQNQFITGDWRVAEKNQEHINGFFYIHHNDLLKANGFNEFIDTYGWDDDDLYSRLEHLDVSRKRVDPKSIFHLHHEDAQRVCVDETDSRNAIDELSRNTFYQIRKNRFIANSMPVWGRRSGCLDVVVTGLSDQYLVVHQKRETYHKVADHIKDDASFYAAAEIISWTTSRRVYDLDKSVFWQYLSEKKIAEMHRLDISVRMFNDTKKLNVTSICWMLNCYMDAYEVYFRKVDFLYALNEYCEANNASIVIRVDTPIFDELKAKIESCDCLFAIPVSEAYGDLDFLSVFDAGKMISQKSTMYLASNIHINSMASLLTLLEKTEAGIKETNIQVPKEKIYIDAQHGLGNRLRAIASGAAIAEKSGRELVVVWEPDHHCEAGMLDLFKYEGALIEKTFVDELSDETDFYNYMEAEPNSDKDAKVTLNESKNLYVRTSCVVNNVLSDWCSENLFLKKLQPVDVINDMVAPFDLDNHIAVHIRMEGAEGLDDHSYERPDNWSVDGLNSLRHWRSKSHYTNFIKRIDRLLDENADANFFLATDRSETYEIFKKVYGERLSLLERSAYDRSIEQIQSALADAILLSKCARLIGSTWSSFTEIAMRLTKGYSSIEMSGKDF